MGCHATHAHAHTFTTQLTMISEKRKCISAIRKEFEGWSNPFDGIFGYSIGYRSPLGWEANKVERNFDYALAQWRQLHKSVGDRPATMTTTTTKLEFQIARAIAWTLFDHFRCLAWIGANRVRRLVCCRCVWNADCAACASLALPKTSKCRSKPNTKQKKCVRNWVIVSIWGAVSVSCLSIAILLTFFPSASGATRREENKTKFAIFRFIVVADVVGGETTGFTFVHAAVCDVCVLWSHFGGCDAKCIFAIYGRQQFCADFLHKCTNEIGSTHTAGVPVLWPPRNSSSYRLNR